MREYIRAIAQVDLHDLLTPYAFCVAVELAGKSWTEETTRQYGIELRDRVQELAAELRQLETKRSTS